MESHGASGVREGLGERVGWGGESRRGGRINNFYSSLFKLVFMDLLFSKKLICLNVNLLQFRMI